MPLKSFSINSRILMIAIAFVIFAFLYEPFLSAQSCGCEVSDAKEQEYNDLLVLDDIQKSDSESVHLPWGVPVSNASASNEHLLHQVDYIIGYDDDLRIPIWVASRLTTADVTVERPRTECFRRDPRLSDDAAAFCADYNEPVYDQGHMVPNADMTRTEPAMINTYIYTNITPQHDKFNRGIWAYLEAYARALTKVKGEVYIISGSIFDKDGNAQRDEDIDADRVAPSLRVGIPTHFYKIILYERSNGFIDTLTFLLPHTDVKITGTIKKDNYLREHLTTIDSIEAVSGLDLFEALPNHKETAVEAFQATELWSSIGN
jgi:DNA/RNA endonuclease G (NUC1)